MGAANSDGRIDADADGPSLLNWVMAFVRRHVVMEADAAVAVTLWVVHTHAIAAAEVTPFLHITAAEKRSGKTRLLEVLSVLVARPWLTSRATAAVLVRKTAAEMPTLLLDETDAAFGYSGDYSEALRAIFDSGFQRGGVASLCVRQGADFQLKDFPVFGPKAFAGIGSVPDTVADRSIPIFLKRRISNEAIQRFRLREAKVLASPLRERLARWATAKVEALADAQPDIPNELDDRAADGWEPLLAIADAVGGDWPQRARMAALALSAGEDREDDSPGVRLLIDIRGTFHQRRVDRLSSASLILALIEIEDAPWGDLKGKRLNPSILAKRLRPYRIRPHQIRLGEKTLKGYELADFADAWRRYLPPESETSETNETDWKPHI